MVAIDSQYDTRLKENDKDLVFCFECLVVVSFKLEAMDVHFMYKNMNMERTSRGPRWQKRYHTGLNRLLI